MDFVGADKEYNTVIFVKNATEALNKISAIYNFCEGDTPNLMGAVALASAIIQINDIGMMNIEDHEYILTEYLLKNMKEKDNIRIYGATEDNTKNRLGIVAFKL